MEKPEKAQLFGIPPKLRELVLRKLDLLPRGEVNDLCVALEQAMIINVEIKDEEEK